MTGLPSADASVSATTSPGSASATDAVSPAARTPCRCRATTEALTTGPSDDRGTALPGATTTNGPVLPCRSATASAHGPCRRRDDIAHVPADPVVGAGNGRILHVTPQAEHERDDDHDRHEHSDADRTEHISGQRQLHDWAPYATDRHSVRAETSGALPSPDCATDQRERSSDLPGGTGVSDRPSADATVAVVSGVAAGLGRFP